MRYIFILLILIISCTALYAQSDKLEPIDRTYHSSVRSVLLYPNTDQITGPVTPPILLLGEPKKLLLSYDDLSSENDVHYVKIYNCNKDWSVSNLNAIMYMQDYNEFIIQDRSVSNGTFVPYIHYKFLLPPVKISGNFLVVVYKNADEDELVLSRRFIVYENIVSIQPQMRFAFNNNQRNTGQQCDFSIKYPEFQIVNPMERMYVVVRQNYSWYMKKEGFKPTFMNDAMATYDYVFFNGENVFPGGNEYRQFDIRSLRTNGLNVEQIKRPNSGSEVLLLKDKNKQYESYGFWQDINGTYVPENYETKNHETDPDYAYVEFRLEKSFEKNKSICVLGAFSNFRPMKEYQLYYDDEEKVYRGKFLLKQGYYNYRYVIVDEKGEPDETLLEGNHAATENEYDFIVYYRAPGGLYDRIIGYRKSRINGG